jgi:hypothetical protein
MERPPLGWRILKWTSITILVLSLWWAVDLFFRAVMDVHP